MNIGDTIAPNSDQLDAVDLLTGPQTFTIQEVKKGSVEQPVDIRLTEFPRVWRPGKSMRRVLVAVWGPDASTYIGRRLTLWCDPTVRFGGAEVGGVRITHMSDLEKSKVVPLLVTRGKSAAYTVKPLQETRAHTEGAPSLLVRPDTLAELAVMFERKGIREDVRLAGVNHITGGSATDLEVITEAEAQQVLKALESRPDVAKSVEALSLDPETAARLATWDDPQAAS